jgi:hypothetical protein
MWAGGLASLARTRLWRLVAAAVRKLTTLGGQLPVHGLSDDPLRLRMVEPMRMACVVLAGIMLSACALASIQRDGSREAPARPVSRFVAYVIGPDALVSSFQANIAVEAARRGLATDNAVLLFPPTHSYADSEIRRGLAERSIDSVLILTIGDAGALRQYAGTILQGRSPVSAAVTTAAVASVYGYPRETTFSALMLDSITGRKLWDGVGQVGIGGFLSFDTGPTVSESVTAIFDDLKVKGILRPRETRGS